MEEGGAFRYTNSDSEEAIRNIADKIRKAGITNESTIEDVIIFAIEEEREAQNFYVKYLQHHKETHSSIKNVIERLINEEKVHESSLVKLLKK